MKGYELETVHQEFNLPQERMNPTGIDEQKIIEGYRSWVLLSGGLFPSSMTMDAIKDIDPNASMTLKQVGWGFQLTVSKNIDIDGKRFGFGKDNPPSEEEAKALREKLQTAFIDYISILVLLFSGIRIN